MRGIHLKGMRDKSNVRQKYYLIRVFIEHYSIQIQKILRQKYELADKLKITTIP
jgi:hypothetical protein